MLPALNQILTLSNSMKVIARCFSSQLSVGGHSLNFFLFHTDKIIGPQKAPCSWGSRSCFWSAMSCSEVSDVYIPYLWVKHVSSSKIQPSNLISLTSFLFLTFFIQEKWAIGETTLLMNKVKLLMPFTRRNLTELVLNLTSSKMICCG